MIADSHDDASILFADIAGFTERAGQMPPCELVSFLDRLYTTFDRLVDKHDLEKIKTTGDSYMVVSGVPEARPDHAEALAALALDMSRAVAGLRDPNGGRYRSGWAWPVVRWSPVSLVRAGSSTTSGGRGQRRLADGEHR